MGRVPCTKGLAGKETLLVAPTGIAGSAVAPICLMGNGAGLLNVTMVQALGSSAMATLRQQIVIVEQRLTQRRITVVQETAKIVAVAVSRTTKTR